MDIEKPNWDRLESEVVTRIRALRSLWEHWDACEVPVLGPWLKDKVLTDLVVPNLELLETFCLSVKIEDDAVIDRPGLGHVGEIDIIEIPRPSMADPIDTIVSSSLIQCPHRPEFWAGGIACSRCDYFRGAAKLENGNAVVRCAFLKENEK